jgi:hypothetical protein
MLCCFSDYLFNTFQFYLKRKYEINHFILQSALSLRFSAKFLVRNFMIPYSEINLGEFLWDRSIYKWELCKRNGPQCKEKAHFSSNKNLPDSLPAIGLLRWYNNYSSTDRDTKIWFDKKGIMARSEIIQWIGYPEAKTHRNVYSVQERWTVPSPLFTDWPGPNPA